MEKHASAFCQTKSEQCLNFEQRISHAKWPFLKTSLKKTATFIISGMPHQEIEPSVQSNSSFHAPSNKTKKISKH